MSLQKVHLEQAFIDHKRALQLFLSRSVESRDDAQDLLQECYVRLAKNPRPLESTDSTRAYLLTIARNLVIDLFRRRSVNGYGRNLDITSLDLVDQAPSPERSLEVAQDLQRLKRCIHRMPETTRKVFLLCRFDEMTYPEIAATLKISTRTVERKMRDAMALLNRNLEGHSVHE